MALDIGVVTIEYLDRPAKPMYAFLQDLTLDQDLSAEGDSGDDGEWGGSWANNGLYEFRRVGLRQRANDWAALKGLGQVEKAALEAWVSSLPWKDERVMLHIGK